MQFNPTDTSISLIADVDFLLFGDGSVFNTEYPLTDRTRNMNIVWDEAISELFKADPNYKYDDTSNTDFPIATIAISSSLDHYTVPDSSLVIHRIRMKNNLGVLTTLTPCLRRELDDDELDDVGSPSKYYKVGNAIFPNPVPDYSVADGVEIEFQRGANHFVTTDTAKTPGFDAQFHQFLSVGTALRYAIANGMSEKVSMLKAMKEEIRKSMVEHYQTRSPDERPKIRIKRVDVGTGL